MKEWMGRGVFPNIEAGWWRLGEDYNGNKIVLRYHRESGEWRYEPGWVVDDLGIRYVPDGAGERWESKPCKSAP